MPTKVGTIESLIGHRERLAMYRDYVGECIEESVWPNGDVTPVPFQEWRDTIYGEDEDQFTSLVTLDVTGEFAADGYLTGGSDSRSYTVRIPEGIVTETGGIVDVEAMQKFAKKLVDRLGTRLPSVMYRGRQVYFWTWTI